MRQKERIKNQQIQIPLKIKLNHLNEIIVLYSSLEEQLKSDIFPSSVKRTGTGDAKKPQAQKSYIHQHREDLRQIERIEKEQKD